MTDVDIMYEAESARMWEEENGGDEKLKSVFENVSAALENMEQASSFLEEGAEDAGVFEDRIESIRHDLDALYFDLWLLKKKIRRECA